MTNAATQDEQMPDAMIKRDLSNNVKWCARCVQDTSQNQPEKSGGGQGLSQGGHGENDEPAHEDIDECGEYDKFVHKKDLVNDTHESQSPDDSEDGPSDGPS
jgi:hypothetical protein